MPEPGFSTTVGDQATVEKIINAGAYNEALRPTAQASFPQFVAVPDRNPRFVGRAEELAELRGRGGSDTPVVIAQAAVGLGGIGKSALASEYCHQRRDRTDVVRWLNAENRTTLEAEFLRTGPAVGVDTHGLDFVDAAARIRGWFERTGMAWLLVFDNAESPAVLQQLIPAQGRGEVLVTSRHQDWSGAGVTPLRLGVLDHAEAVELLCRTAGRPADEEAGRLVEHLGGLALAVKQAGGYVRQTGCSFGRYRELLTERAADLLARGSGRSPGRGGDDVTVLTVWDVSLQRAAQEAEGAGAVLGVLASGGQLRAPGAAGRRARRGRGAAARRR